MVAGSGEDVDDITVAGDNEEGKEVDGTSIGSGFFGIS
jgi:hypothetical protein